MFVNKYLIRAANFAEGWLEEVKLTVNCSDKIKLSTAENFIEAVFEHSITWPTYVCASTAYTYLL